MDQQPHPFVARALKGTGGLIFIHGRESCVLSEELSRAIFEDWMSLFGADVLIRNSMMLESGQEIVSPVCPEFRYKAASEAGKQQQLI